MLAILAFLLGLVVGAAVSFGCLCYLSGDIAGKVLKDLQSSGYLKK